MTAFRDYVTSTAFALTISRRQIEFISQLHQFGDSWLLLSTFDALARKGLVERVRSDHNDQIATGATVRLTEAGRAVVPLLKLVGLLIEYPPMPEPVELPEINVTVKARRPVATEPQEGA